MPEAEGLGQEGGASEHTQITPARQRFRVVDLPLKGGGEVTLHAFVIAIRSISTR